MTIPTLRRPRLPRTAPPGAWRLLALAAIIALSGCGDPRPTAGDRPLRDLLTRLPAGDGVLLFFGDLDAHRETIGPAMPPDGATADELLAHGRNLKLPGELPWAPASRFEPDPSLRPLVRSSAYAFMSWDGPRVQEDFLDTSTATVLTGDFGADAFGRLTPDDELGSARKVRAAGAFLEDDGDHWLTVRDGTVTLARNRDDIATAVDAQDGTTPSLADVPAFARLFEELDDLAVIHGVATVPVTTSAVDAAAVGIRVDPQRAGSWQLIVAHHARDEAGAQRSSVPGSSNIGFTTDQLTALTEEFTRAHDTGTARITADDDVAVAVIPVEDPTLWQEQSTTMQALLWGGEGLPGLEDVPASEPATVPPVNARPSEHGSPPATTDVGTDASTGPASLVDLVDVVPADGSCFSIDVGDFNAHWAAMGLPAPTATTSEYELLEYVRAFDALMVHGPLSVFADPAGDREALLPLVRGAAYVRDEVRNTEVVTGDFTAATFGRFTPDEALDGVGTLAVDGMFGTTTGSGRLTIDQGTATFSTTPDGKAAAVSAQRGDVVTLAAVPAAVDLVSALDDLDVVHGHAARMATTRLVDGDAWGLSADPERPGSWRLHVLYRPRDDDGLDELTTTMAELAATAADEHGAEAIDVTAHDGYAVATFRFTEPRSWLDVRLAMAPGMWDDLYLPTSPDKEC